MRILLLAISCILSLLLFAQETNKKWSKPKGSLVFKIAIPEGNFILLEKQYEVGHENGFLGLSGGVEYQFSDKYSINLDMGGLTDFVSPIPVPYDIYGTYDRSFALYGDLQIGRNFHRFHVDAGIQYHKSFYMLHENVDTFPAYIDTLKFYRDQHNAGLAFSAYFSITRSFNIGLNYYPSMVVFGKSEHSSNYRHLLFFELLFLIRGNKQKKP